MRWLLLGATFAGLASAQAVSEPRAALGALPDGAVSGFEIAQVTEICARQLFPADAAPSDLPAGYRLLRLSERSTPWATALLRQRPELADHAGGSFCFVEAGMHEVDGHPVHPGRPSRVAFLWADVVPAAAARTDARFRGTRVRRAQLLFFYDREHVDRRLAVTATPGAAFARIIMDRRGEAWSLRLEAEESFVTAELSASGPRRRLDYPLPGYETIVLGGAARGLFTVVTFAGHHEREAEGRWRAAGAAPWARIFKQGTSRGNFIQDGWIARSALYRF